MLSPISLQLTAAILFFHHTDTFGSVCVNGGVTGVSTCALNVPSASKHCIRHQDGQTAQFGPGNLCNVHVFPRAGQNARNMVTYNFRQKRDFFLQIFRNLCKKKTENYLHDKFPLKSQRFPSKSNIFQEWDSQISVFPSMVFPNSADSITRQFSMMVNSLQISANSIFVT